MKHTLIILLVVIFTTACSSNAPAPTSTTFISSPTHTTEPTETAIPAPEAKVTETAKAPEKVSTLVAEIPFVTIEEFTSPEFADQALKDLADGKFPANPNGKPLTSCNVLPAENNNILKKYGMGPIFEPSQADIATQKKAKDKGWFLSMLRRTEIGGLKFFIELVGWNNQDGPDGSKTPPGLTANLVYDNGNMNDLKENENFKSDFINRSSIPLGMYLDPDKIDATLKKYFLSAGVDDTEFIEWYKKNSQTLLFDEKFWRQCEKTGVFANEITDANGQKVPFIPLAISDSTGY